MKVSIFTKYFISFLAFVAVITVQTGAANRLVNADDEKDVIGLLIQTESSSEESIESFDAGRMLTPIHFVESFVDFFLLPVKGMLLINNDLKNNSLPKLFLLFHSLKVFCF
ncbi:MAG: hypothetical protein NWR73_02150 [Flavobacteriales bacterium]|nr:hypothetical protein [Flavobacteriales bacterium]